MIYLAVLAGEVVAYGFTFIWSFSSSIHTHMLTKASEDSVCQGQGTWITTDGYTKKPLSTNGSIL